MRKDGCTMTIPPLQVGDQVVVEHGHFQQLLVALRSRGYEVVGPTVRDNAIVYDTLTSVADLPVGYTDEPDGGTYRLKQRADSAWFGDAVGHHSWKQFLHAPVSRLWQTKREERDLRPVPEPHEQTRFELIGVGLC